MLAIPKRVSLSSQVFATLRQGLEEGAWNESLPSERSLCEWLQVSRPTLRMALHLLENEGLIATRRGKRSRILVSHRPQPSNRLVAIVANEPVLHMSIVAHHGITEVRARLAERGFSTVVFVCQGRSEAVRRRKLEGFFLRNPVACCLLASGSLELQKWFADRSIPALMLGSCHSSIQLPSLDVNYCSVCRHACGVFLSKGHRRVALVVPESGVAGDINSEKGFLEAVDQRNPSDHIAATIVRHTGTARSIGLKLDTLFRSSRAPTALLVAKPQDVFIVIIYLLKRGLTMPDQVSLIARDPDNLFMKVDPPVSHYRFDFNSYIHRLNRLMVQMVSQGYLPPEPHLMYSRFFAGNTVKTLA